MSTVSGMELGARVSRGVTVVIGREVPHTHCEEILDRLQVHSGLKNFINTLPSVYSRAYMSCLTCKGHL